MPVGPRGSNSQPGLRSDSGFLSLGPPVLLIGKQDQRGDVFWRRLSWGQGEERRREERMIETKRH